MRRIGGWGGGEERRIMGAIRGLKLGELVLTLVGEGLDRRERSDVS